MTLPELIMALLIVSLLTVVLGGLMSAVGAAREHVEGVEEATLQGAAAMERIRYMVANAGVYQTSGQPVTPGIAVVNRSAGGTNVPDVLVVWSGGRSGGMAANGLLTQLPKINELVIFLPDPGDPSVLTELMVPGNSSTIDFRSGGFSATILSLVSGGGTEKVPLCKKLRLADLSGTATGGAWFEATWSPTDAAIAANTPGTAGWNALLWPQGIVTSESGCRQVTVRTELQIETRSYQEPGSDTSPTALPFFGSASYRYDYIP